MPFPSCQSLILKDIDTHEQYIGVRCFTKPRHLMGMSYVVCRFRKRCTRQAAPDRRNGNHAHVGRKRRYSEVQLLHEEIPRTALLESPIYGRPLPKLIGADLVKNSDDPMSVFAIGCSRIDSFLLGCELHLQPSMPESNKDQLVEFTARNTYLTCDQGFQRVGPTLKIRNAWAREVGTRSNNSSLVIGPNPIQGCAGMGLRIVSGHKLHTLRSGGQSVYSFPC
jgi:hypothetical protein